MIKPTFHYEQELWLKGYQYVAGLDEVGRGALAGPVVAGAVVFPKWLTRVAAAEGRFAIAKATSSAWTQSSGEGEAVGWDEPLAGPAVLHNLRDSKLLSPKQREILAPLIKNYALAWAVGAVSPKVIDRVGIAAATERAMLLAITKLQVTPDFHLIDFFRLKGLSPECQSGVANGDTLVASIAAASVIAKVYRDALMTGFHATYPRYGFDRHKGYGTEFHKEALRRLGPCPLHRLSFLN